MNRIAAINIASLLYLAFVVAMILAVAEHNPVRLIIRATARRWLKLTGALFLLTLIVHLVSSL